MGATGLRYWALRPTIVEPLGIGGATFCSARMRFFGEEVRDAIGVAVHARFAITGRCRTGSTS
jgi:hypothetical protein